MLSPLEFVGYEVEVDQEPGRQTGQNGCEARTVTLSGGSKLKPFHRF
jgi:hypothetical protein